MKGAGPSALPHAAEPSRVRSDGDAAGEDLGDAQTFVQKDNVGVGVGAQHAFFVLNAEKGGRIQGQHAERIRETSAEADNVAKGAVERKGATSQAAFGVATHAATHSDFETAKEVFAIGHSCGRDAVADEDDAHGSFSLKQQAHGCLVDMDAIGDQLGGDVRRGENGADYARVAMRKGTHGVEGVDGEMG